MNCLRALSRTISGSKLIAQVLDGNDIEPSASESPVSSSLPSTSTSPAFTAVRGIVAFDIKQVEHGVNRITNLSDAVDPAGNSLLHIAAARGNTEAVALLIGRAHSEFLVAENENGMTAADTAASMGFGLISTAITAAIKTVPSMYDASTSVDQLFAAWERIG